MKMRGCNDESIEGVSFEPIVLARSQELAYMSTLIQIRIKKEKEPERKATRLKVASSLEKEAFYILR